jgi:hypothetical protein
MRLDKKLRRSGWKMSIVLCGLTWGCQEKSASPPEVPPGDSQSQHSPELSGEVTEAGFQPLSLQDFEPFQAEKDTWTQVDEMIVTSGLPKSYIYTKKSYENFTLQAEFQFVLTQEQEAKFQKANTGILLAIQEPHKIWPRSLEVQGQFETMGTVRPNGGIPAPAMQDQPAVRERVRRPAADWNRMEIRMRGGAITAILNGETVCTSEPGELKSGPIGLQAEGYVVRFRNLSIREDVAQE